MKEIPVYVAGGFLESGKTTLINELLQDREFLEGRKILIISCEEGEVEFDPGFLSEISANIVTVECQEDFNKKLFKELKKTYQPDLAFLEFNGTWNPDLLFEQIPKEWPIVEIFTMIDAATYSVYMTNMRSIMMGLVKYSDCAIVNRCTPDIQRAAIRRNLRGATPSINVIFEDENGELMEDGPEDLPFIINGDEIRVEEEDFAVLMVELQDNPDAYIGKTIETVLMAYTDEDMPDGFYYGGRHVMTCCEQDAAFAGFMCRCSFDFESMGYYRVRGVLTMEENEMYTKTGPVLTIESQEHLQGPKQPYVYL